LKDLFNICIYGFAYRPMNKLGSRSFVIICCWTAGRAVPGNKRNVGPMGSSYGAIKTRHG